MTDEHTDCLAKIGIEVLGDTLDGRIYVFSEFFESIRSIANIGWFGERRLKGVAGRPCLDRSLSGRDKAREINRIRIAIAVAASESPQVHEKCFRNLERKKGYVCDGCSRVWRGVMDREDQRVNQIIATGDAIG